MQFWGFSVLHCHDVFPSGDQQQQQQKRLQQQEEKPAKIHSSSKKKKQPKSSFSMGFRSYVRHFRGAILGLLRPSLPWCFPIRGPAAAAKAFIFIAAARKKQPKSSFSMGFRSYVRHFRGAILGLLRPSLPWCFPIRGPAAAAAAKALIFIAAARGKSSQNHHFLWVSEVTLGIFGVQFWGFSVLHCHGFSHPGTSSSSSKSLHIHSSSKRKKQRKSSFSMGFRSYVRHFRGAILGLLRPSLPWCFPIRGPAAAAAKASAAAGRKASQNS